MLSASNFTATSVSMNEVMATWNPDSVAMNYSLNCINSNCTFIEEPAFFGQATLIVHSGVSLNICLSVSNSCDKRIDCDFIDIQYESSSPMLQTSEHPTIISSPGTMFSTSITPLCTSGSCK